MAASFWAARPSAGAKDVLIAGFALAPPRPPAALFVRLALNTLALLFLALATGFSPRALVSPPALADRPNERSRGALPATLSVQPWLTLDCCVTLIAGLAWIYYVTTLEAHLRDIRLAARVFAGGIIALAGAVPFYLYLLHARSPFWHNVRGFGPYPNRNQTGDLFGISTLLVLGCMQDDFRRGHKRWLVLAHRISVCSCAALILAFSRAGILILVIGVAAWLVRIVFCKWTGAGVAVAALGAPLVLRRAASLRRRNDRAFPSSPSGAEVR